MRTVLDHLRDGYWHDRRIVALHDFMHLPKSPRVGAIRAALVEQCVRPSDAVFKSFVRAAFEQICDTGAIPVGSVSDLELRQAGIHVEPNIDRPLRGLRLVDLPDGWGIHAADGEITPQMRADEGYIINDHGERVFSVFFRAGVHESIGYVHRVEPDTHQQ